MSGSIDLRPVDAVDVTLVVDNFVDILMANQDGVTRFALAVDWAEREQLVAEHGFSALVTIWVDGTPASLLYDGGVSAGGLTHNLDVMGIDPASLRALVISHGHADHHGGLEGMFRRRRMGRMPLLIHPGAWRERRIVFPTGHEILVPPPSKRDLEAEGLEVIEERGPTLLIDGRFLVSGQVERTTDFETGFPIHQSREPGGPWEPDPLILDDQNLIVHVRGRGLVIVSGCSHAGAVNVLRNAQRLSGEPRIAGFIGGFHLTGTVFEPLVEPTVAAFAEAGVERVIPGHCTGWRAMHALSRTLPDGFVQPSVGSVFRFEATSH